MAVAMESFSIREYAAKMRSVDIGKCWPFDKEGEMQKSLPPISFPKFRWWSNELEAARSQILEKGKQKTVKKRSIVELFAVSPQIKPNDDDDDDEEDTMEAGEGDRVASKTPRKPMRKNEKLKVDKCAKKEGEKDKTILHHTDSSHLLKEPVSKKWFETIHMDPVDSPKQNLPTVKNSADSCNFKDTQCLKLISKQQKVANVFPAHGILKNPSRTASAKNTSVIGDAQDDNLLKACRGLVKHVTFLGQDDTGGKENKAGPSLELPPPQTLCQILIDVLPSSRDTNDSRKGEKIFCPTEGDQVVNVKGKDVVSNVMEKTVNDSCKPSSTSIGLDNMTYTDAEDVCWDKTVDLTSAMRIYSGLNRVNSYSGKQHLLNPANEKDSNFDGGIIAEESNLRTYFAHSSTVPTESGVSKSDVQVAKMNVTSQPLTSCSMMSNKANERCPDISVGQNISFIRDIPESRQNCLFPPKHIKRSICFSTGPRRFGESNLASELLPIYRDKCVDENFVGLPLNSHGELIKLHSGGNLGFTDLFRKQKRGGCSVHNFASPDTSQPKCKNHLGKVKMKYSASPLYQKDQLKWSSEQYCPPTRQITSGLNFAELQNVDIRDVSGHEWVKDQNRYVSYYPNQVKHSGHGCLGFGQSQNLRGMERFQSEGRLNQTIQHFTRPTVRLMGKNVTVSESSNECQASTYGSIWTDRGSLTERSSTNPHSNRWLQQQQVARSAFGTSERNLLQTVNTPVRLYFPGMQSRSVLNPSDFQQQWSSNCISLATGNLGSVVQNSNQPLYPEAMVNGTHKSRSKCNSSIDSVWTGSHISGRALHPPDMCQLMLLNSTHSKHSQSLCYGTSSTVPASFPDSDHGNFVRPLSASPPSYMSQWPINAKEQRNQSTSPCFDPFSGNHPYAQLGTDLTFPSPYPASMFPFPTCNTDDLALSNPASLAQSLHMLTYLTSRPTSTVSAAYRNMDDNNNEINTRTTYFGGAHAANLSKKRPADRSDGLMRPGKKPALTSHWDSCAPIEPRRRELFHGYIPCNTEPHSLLGYGYKRMAMSFQRIDKEKDRYSEFSKSSRSGFSKHDNVLRPAVVRLRAGAKHILRPSQDMGTDNARAVHSIIPFEVGTRSSKPQISLKKTTKIYSF